MSLGGEQKSTVNRFSVTALGNTGWSLCVNPPNPIYYFNAETKQSSWTLPLGQLPSGWTEQVSNEGEIQYCNNSTGEISKVWPEGDVKGNSNSSISPNIATASSNSDQAPKSKKQLQEEERKRRQEEDRQKQTQNNVANDQALERMFFDLLREHRASEKTEWSALLVDIVLDPRFTAIKGAAKKKELFTKYLQQQSSQQDEAQKREEQDMLHGQRGVVENVILRKQNAHPQPMLPVSVEEEVKSDFDLYAPFHDALYLQTPKPPAYNDALDIARKEIDYYEFILLNALSNEVPVPAERKAVVRKVLRQLWELEAQDTFERVRRMVLQRRQVVFYMIEKTIKNGLPAGFAWEDETVVLDPPAMLSILGNTVEQGQNADIWFHFESHTADQVDRTLERLPSWLFVLRDEVAAVVERWVELAQRGMHQVATFCDQARRTVLAQTVQLLQVRRTVDPSFVSTSVDIRDNNHKLALEQIYTQTDKIPFTMLDGGSYTDSMINFSIMSPQNWITDVFNVSFLDIPSQLTHLTSIEQHLSVLAVLSFFIPTLATGSLLELTLLTGQLAVLKSKVDSISWLQLLCLDRTLLTQSQSHLTAHTGLMQFYLLLVSIQKQQVDHEKTSPTAQLCVYLSLEEEQKDQLAKLIQQVISPVWQRTVATQARTLEDENSKYAVTVRGEDRIDRVVDVRSILEYSEGVQKLRWEWRSYDTTVDDQELLLLFKSKMCESREDMFYTVLKQRVEVVMSSANSIFEKKRALE